MFTYQTPTRHALLAHEKRHSSVKCLVFVWMRAGPQNNQRYGADSGRLRQPVDVSVDSERDTGGGGGRQQQRNGKPQ